MDIKKSEIEAKNKELLKEVRADFDDKKVPLDTFVEKADRNSEGKEIKEPVTPTLSVTTETLTFTYEDDTTGSLTVVTGVSLN